MYIMINDYYNLHFKCQEGDEYGRVQDTTLYIAIVYIYILPCTIYKVYLTALTTQERGPCDPEQLSWEHPASQAILHG